MERILINLDSRVKLKKSWCATNRKLRKDFVWNNKKWKILKIPKNYICTDPTAVGSSRLTTSLSVSHQFLLHQNPNRIALNIDDAAIWDPKSLNENERKTYFQQQKIPKVKYRASECIFFTSGVISTQIWSTEKMCPNFLSNAIW